MKNVNLTIQKGQNIGIVGLTGGGKSTLLDLIMGLIIPDSGEIIIDDINLINDNYPEEDFVLAILTRACSSKYIPNRSIDC